MGQKIIETPRLGHSSVYFASFSRVLSSLLRCHRLLCVIIIIVIKRRVTQKSLVMADMSFRWLYRDYSPLILFQLQSKVYATKLYTHFVSAILSKESSRRRKKKRCASRNKVEFTHAMHKRRRIPQSHRHRQKRDASSWIYIFSLHFKLDETMRRVFDV